MSQNAEAIIVARGTGRRVGNVELLALSEHTPRFNVSISALAPGRHGPEAHIHDDEDDAFYVLDGDLQFVIEEQEIPAGPGTFVLVPPGVMHTFMNPTSSPVQMLNIHAPAGFDRRLLFDDPES
jgi:mannose-6-phosphate isomerase-like protein (cupin superfamily)